MYLRMRYRSDERRRIMSKYDLKLFRKADILIYLLIAVLAAAIFFSVFRQNQNENGYLLIKCGEETKTCTLSDNTSFALTNNGFTLNVKIEDGEVYVSDTDCPDEICRKSGKISRPGQSIVCVPAEISLRIAAWEDIDYDAVTH